MRHQKDKLHSKNIKQKELPSLKKLPAKKAASKSSKNKSKNIVVEAKARKDHSSLLEIIKRKVPGGPKTPMPQNLRPMLATLVDEPLTDTEWQFEMKQDGYRTLAYLHSGKVDLRSRKNNSFNKQFDDVRKALENWKIDAVIDGEVWC
jgi:bifunctional non-homologous end joining protein LigD